MAKKLYKSTKNKMLFGVCGGLADYFNIDVTIVRIIFVILGLISGSGIIIYLVAALIMPTHDRFDDDENVENLKRANVDPEETGKSEKSSNNKKNPNARSDEEFDSYFKK